MGTITANILNEAYFHDEAAAFTHATIVGYEEDMGRFDRKLGKIAEANVAGK